MYYIYKNACKVRASRQRAPTARGCREVEITPVRPTRLDVLKLFFFHFLSLFLPLSLTHSLFFALGDHQGVVRHTAWPRCGTDARCTRSCATTSRNHASNNVYRISQKSRTSSAPEIQFIAKLSQCWETYR